MNEKTHESCTRNRLNLLAKGLDRVSTDSSQQPTITPFLSSTKAFFATVCRICPEQSAYREALGFQREQRLVDGPTGEAQRCRQGWCGHRPQRFQPAAHDLDQCLLSGCLDTAGIVTEPRRFDLRLHWHVITEYLQHLPKPLGTDPQHPPPGG